MVVSDDIRRQLASLGASRRTRTAIFTAARPTDWNPTATLHPATGESFTPDGAWEFVCGLIGQGIEIETIVLDKPPGRTGYVITCDGHGGETIYIKLQLGSGQVIGRSFHHSKLK